MIKNNYKNNKEDSKMYYDEKGKILDTILDALIDIELEDMELVNTEDYDDEDVELESERNYVSSTKQDKDEYSYLEQVRETNKRILKSDITVKRVKGEKHLYEATIKKINFKFIFGEIHNIFYESIILLIKEYMDFKDDNDFVKAEINRGLGDIETLINLELEKSETTEAINLIYTIGEYDIDGNIKETNKSIITLLTVPYIRHANAKKDNLLSLTEKEISDRHLELFGKVNPKYISEFGYLYATMFETIDKYYQKDKKNIIRLYAPEAMFFDDNEYNTNVSYNSNEVVGYLLRYVNFYNIYYKNRLDIKNNRDGYYAPENPGRLPDKMAGLSVKEVTGFKDVYGLEKIKEQLNILGKAILYNYNNPKEPIEIPKGVLFVGAPGTGKTLIANAFVKEFNFRFINMSDFTGNKGIDGNSFSRGFSQANVVAQYAPTVLFIDELDKLFTDFNIQNITILLDLLSKSTNVLVIAASNSDNFPEFLTRPGRFDKKIYFGDISFQSKVEIFKNILDAKDIKTKNINIPTVIDYLPQDITVAYLDSIAKQIKVMETLNLRNTDTAEVIEIADDLLDGISEVVQYDTESTERIAWHEAGHAAIGLLTGQKITVATIKRSYKYGGYVMLKYAEDKWLSYTDYEKSILTSLGGWASEKLIYGDFSVGASSDFAFVQGMINFLTTQTGASGSHLISLNPMLDINRSLEQASDIYKVKKSRTKKYVRETEKLLRKHRDLLARIKNVLLAKEKVSGDEIHEIYDNYLKEKGL